MTLNLIVGADYTHGIYMPATAMPTALAFNETAIGAVRDREFGALFVRDFGTMVTVPVSVDADPCPTVQWFFNGALT